jgi:glycosyltransferase involved in cell wall biosynthesis
MRIAIIAPPWVPIPPPAYGGTEAVIDRLARGFATRGHEVLLFCTGDSTCEVPRQWVLERAEGDRMGAAAIELRHLVHAYEAVQDYDIVHDHTLVGPIYSGRYPDLHVVTTNHGPFNPELADLYGAIADDVPIIAISHDQARGAGNLRLAAVIHHGIEPEAFPVGAGDGGYVLFLGRMAPEKGARRAAQIAHEAGVKLLIAAKMREQWERDYFDAEVKPLLSEDVQYVGEVGVEEKLELLGGAQALLNPIRWPEPFGLVMIEALACGTPVLTYKEGAAPEIVEQGITGWLCDHKEDMVEALGRLGELKRAECRAIVETYFSTDRMVEEHLELFQRVIAGEHPRYAGI